MSKQKICQSCGMPMKRPEEFGTNKDGSQNDEYCIYCFKDGKFTMPNLTMEEMLVIGMKGVDENKEMSRAMKFMIKKMYPAQMKRLKRWS